MEITKTVASKCAEKVSEILKPVLGLENWKITWRFESIGETEPGEAALGAAVTDYTGFKLLVSVDPLRHDEDFEDFIDTLRHELLHATHFMWNRYYRSLTAMVDKSSHGFIEPFWVDACEEHVSFMGRMLDRMGFSAHDLEVICRKMLESKPSKA